MSVDKAFLWSQFVAGIGSFEDVDPDSDWKSIITAAGPFSALEQGIILKMVHDKLGAQDKPAAAGEQNRGMGQSARPFSPDVEVQEEEQAR